MHFRIFIYNTTFKVKTTPLQNKLRMSASQEDMLAGMLGVSMMIVKS